VDREPRDVAHVLTRISDLLVVRGANRFQAKAYRTAARAVRELTAADLRARVRSGRLADVRGIGPSTAAVITELVDTGESSLLERLRAETPPGLIDVLRIPGLTLEQVQRFHAELGIDSLESLEQTALDGRLGRLPRIGPKTVERILRGIAQVRHTSTLTRYPEAAAEAERVRATVAAHPDVDQATIAGSVRRYADVVADIDVVAVCRGDPTAVAAAFARGAPPDADGAVRVRFVDGVTLDLTCVAPERFAAALWRATGSADHVAQVAAHAARRGLPIAGDSEQALYAALGLAYIEPELREGTGEVDAARTGRLPSLVTPADIRGVLHAHSTYSDGRATIDAMAAGARARGWRYLGISDHSRSAFYAGGMRPDAVVAQHEEIDRLNAASTDGFRILKGIEADILPDGTVDQGSAPLDRFDYVIASIHSRFSMDRARMTARVLRALDNPYVRILGHPTGRLLLTREPYDIDLDAVLAKAAALGVAVELNADPNRLDLSWRWCQAAKRAGATVVIGPDAHSVDGLDYMALGVAMARKGWLEPSDIMNTRDADTALVSAARSRRAPRRPRS
jgi:DNA polymerase (family X)